MAIITKPSTIYKNTPTVFTLNKADLIAAINDPYFQDDGNWEKVQIVYKSSTGNQSTVVSFNGQDASPEGIFKVSLKARNSFQVTYVIVRDFDDDFFTIPRSSLNTSHFDLTVS